MMTITSRLAAIMAKLRDVVFANRPMTYICVVLATSLAGAAYNIQNDSIFGCQASGYSSDRYLGNCNASHYGDYEHGAFAFDLEPSAINFARHADVVFLGNSRLQFGFSTNATADWFSAAQVRYYLLGFAGYENVTFMDGLLRKIGPRASVYVINIDDFFYTSESEPGKVVLHDPDARDRYETKRFWQRFHEPICKRFPAICRHHYGFFRSRETGAYSPEIVLTTHTPVSFDETIDRDVVDSNAATASDFLSHLPVNRRCIIFTLVPSGGTKIGNVKAIASAVGGELITPDVGSELYTFDGSHFERASAELWSQAFFQAAGSKIRSCLDRQHAANE